jgi:hypothetical protein
MSHDDSLQQLFDSCTEELSPVHEVNKLRYRVITFEQFKAAIEQKMNEAYYYGGAAGVTNPELY